MTASFFTDWSWSASNLWWDLAIGFVVFVVSFVVSLALATWVILRLPTDYFRDSAARNNSGNQRWHTLLVVGLARNVLGLILVAVGIFLSLPGIPGQGFLTIVLGLMLMQFPGKRYLEKRFLGQPRVLELLNRIRQRYQRPPLLPPQESPHPKT
ncbi:MAG: hypothetical protein NZM42_13920 [Gemmatales bacterium]|nr:hypothetical protein [Gemmatales bacterium]MDW8224148.1 hypothetical protein [Gemmatales bacterium]